MRSKLLIAVAAVLLTGVLVGCSQQRANPPAKENVEQTLSQAGLDRINVDENRDKGVITLKGDVPNQSLKDQAAQLAQQAAPGRVVANELMVKPVGEAGDRAENVQSNMDNAIESRLKAEITRLRYDKLGIDFSVKNGVVKLTGDVATMQQRTNAEKMASAVPGVKQVVNELEIKNQRGAAMVPATQRD
jgi:hyperosmotically inducible protein